ncbi:MAG: gliding motility lipoprotein GldH [Bacteroidota bacterium]
MVKGKRSFIAYSLLFIIAFTGCTQLDVFEKNATIPDHKWSYNFQPAFSFDITDTASEYNLYVVLRHTDAYKYNNIWLNIGSQSPADTMKFQRFDLQLGTDSKGWEGTGMDDIWELRRSVTNGPIRFNKPGKYNFAVAQIMRENPLPNVMSIGIRVEKVK